MTKNDLTSDFFAIIGSGQISGHIPSLFQNLAKNQDCDKRLNFIFFDKKINYELLNLSQSKGVFLAVKDKDIYSIYLTIKDYFPASTPFYHLSGSLYYPELIGIHPLMTFTKDSKNIKYESVPLFTDNYSFYSDNKILFNNLNYLLPELKIYYHTMALMLGNFTQYYLQIVKESFPSSLNFQDYKILVDQSVKTIFCDNSKSRLTGPFIRGDEITIQKQKEELSKKNKKLLNVYKHMEHLVRQELIKL